MKLLVFLELNSDVFGLVLNLILELLVLNYHQPFLLLVRKTFEISIAVLNYLFFVLHNIFFNFVVLPQIMKILLQVHYLRVKQLLLALEVNLQLFNLIIVLPLDFLQLDL